MRVKCLAQEHNTMCLARARARTAHYEATAPPTYLSYFNLKTPETMLNHTHTQNQTSFPKALLFL